MRNWKSLLALTALLGANIVQAAPQESKPVTKPKVQGLFWTATSGENTIYLLGSVHVASQKMYPLPGAMESAFKAAKTLVVEINLNAVDQGKLAQVMQAKGLYQNGDDLTKHLSQDDEKKLEAFCNKNSFPLIAMQKMKPWMASLVVSLLPFLSAGMSTELGIDQHFLNEAAKTHKTVDQAESVEFQLNLLSSTSEKEALKSLHAALNSTETGAGPAFVNKLEEAWIKGDGDTIQKLMDGERAKDNSDRKLLEDRNPHMADVAEKYLKGKSSCFFVVGAAHLLGPEGVVAILKKRGYTVTQVLAAK